VYTISGKEIARTVMVITYANIHDRNTVAKFAEAVRSASMRCIEATAEIALLKRSANINEGKHIVKTVKVVGFASINDREAFVEIAKVAQFVNMNGIDTIA